MVPVGLVSKHVCMYIVCTYGMHAQMHLMTLEGHLVHLALVYGQYALLWYKT